MSGATTATYVAIVASAVAGAYATYESGQSQKEQAKYSAKVQENNAEIAHQQAMDEQNRAAQAYGDKMEDKRRMIATQRAKASGVEADTGTMALIQDETSTLAGLDALRLLNNGQRSAWGLQVDEMNSLAGAAGSRFAGEQASTAGKIGAASSLLSGAASAAGTYKR